MSSEKEDLEKLKKICKSNNKLIRPIKIKPKEFFLRLNWPNAKDIFLGDKK